MTKGNWRDSNAVHVVFAMEQFDSRGSGGIAEEGDRGRVVIITCANSDDLFVFMSS